MRALICVKVEAYPRACRGALISATIFGLTRGLSPRMRGSHILRDQVAQYVGPIPAHAGEPRGRRRRGRRSGAYPRACGGATWTTHTRFSTMGLSPRMRGSLGITSILCRRGGPIPAHAGEPACRLRLRCRSRAYPRACGGASEEARAWMVTGGLSPRMRGSRIHCVSPCAGSGPIPAHAGEPLLVLSKSMTARAYPRACGGATGPGSDWRFQRGLSPRMRGSPPGRAQPGDAFGPIPAHAGEPS